MKDQHPQHPRSGGGVAIALLAIGGAVIGNHFGQASFGLLIGVGAGIAVTLAIWLTDHGK